MKARSIVFIVIVLAGLIVLSNTFYTVDQRERDIVFKFGKIVRADEQPGLHYKMPFVETVDYFDGRIQTMESEPEPFLTKEQKNLVVDSYVKWRVKNVSKYYVTVGGSVSEANRRLAPVVNDGLREEFGKRTVQEVVSGERAQIMNILQKDTNKEAAEYGIEVLDVRLKRVDLAPDISQSVYKRMESERKRSANKHRAEGKGAAEKIRAEADRQRTVIIADARRDADQIRGEGDAEATLIYAKAYSKDPNFYSLYRSLTAYKQSFNSEKDVLVLSPDTAFFKYFKQPGK